jgi:hypothetical protein
MWLGFCFGGGLGFDSNLLGGLYVSLNLLILYAYVWSRIEDGMRNENLLLLFYIVVAALVCKVISGVCLKN